MPPRRRRPGSHQKSDRGGGGGPRHPPQHPGPQDEGVRPVREPLVQGVPPLRVEKALGLLPDLEALEPLRSLLVSISRPDERALWSSSGPYLTLGKRGVRPEELRHRIPQVFHRIAGHLEALFTAYVEALECQQRGDGVGVVEALLTAGRLEEGVGRVAQALEWYAVALRVSQGLQDRHPEVGTLQALGRACLRLGMYAEGARHYQRCLALAEAEFDQAAAIAACEGLGKIAQAQVEWVGAEAWYARGVRLAEASGDQRRIGGTLMRQLVQIYTMLGALRGRQLDETGFVFFEQAIELSRTVEPSSLAEAQVYEEYGLFQLRVGDRETARAYLERARDIYESTGGATELEHVRKELQQLSA